MVSCSAYIRASLMACGQVCRNASYGDAHLRWTNPSIAREPSRPAPPVMRANRTRWAGWWGERLRDVGERKDFDVLPTPMIDPRPSKRTTSHIHPLRRSKKTGLRFEGGRCWKEAANSTDSACSVAFGSTCLALLPQGTRPTVIQLSHEHGPLGERVLLSLFTQSQSRSGWAAQRNLIMEGKRAGRDLAPATISGQLPGAGGLGGLLR